jgi:hypothetical protein
MKRVKLNDWGDKVAILREEKGYSTATDARVRNSGATRTSSKRALLKTIKTTARKRKLTSW